VHLGRIRWISRARRQLHSVLAVVPQRSVLFEGTVASNLDPRGRCAPPVLLQALLAVGLLPALQQRAARSNVKLAQARQLQGELQVPAEGGTAVLAPDDAEQPLLAAWNNGCGARNDSALDSSALQLELSGNGQELSAAQQQQLGMARALLLEPLCAPKHQRTM
jgi:ABC-type multidrug transport system fused ATPase/permease subunit